MRSPRYSTGIVDGNHGRTAFQTPAIELGRLLNTRLSLDRDSPPDSNLPTEAPVYDRPASEDPKLPKEVVTDYTRASSDLKESSDARLDDKQTQSSNTYIPLVLRRTSLFIFFVILAAFVVALEILSYVSKRDQGLGSSTQNKHYSWTYGPTAGRLCLSCPPSFLTLCSIYTPCDLLVQSRTSHKAFNAMESNDEAPASKAQSAAGLRLAIASCEHLQLSSDGPLCCHDSHYWLIIDHTHDYLLDQSSRTPVKNRDSPGCSHIIGRPVR